MAIYPTIAEALTLGGTKLAVDGVLLSASTAVPAQREGPDPLPALRVLPADRRGLPAQRPSRAGLQRQAPLVAAGIGRRRWSTPPASWASRSWPARRCRSPGASPSVDMPLGRRGRRRRLRRLRRRRQLRLPRPRDDPVHGRAARGGETGVAAVQAYPRRRGLAGPARRIVDRGRLRPGAVRGLPLPQLHARLPAPGLQPRLPDARRHAAAVVATRSPTGIEYADGLKATMLLMNGLVPRLQLRRSPRRAGRAALHPDVPARLPPAQTLPNFFSPLAHHIETMFLTGKPPYPVERTLLTTGLVAAAVDCCARARRARDAAPGIAYQAPRESTFWRIRWSRRPVPSDPLAAPAARRWRSSPRSGRYLSHAQHMGDRFLVGYPDEGRWHRPRDRRRLALRRPAARGRPERRAGARASASRSIRRSPKPSAAAATAGRRRRAAHRRARRLPGQREGADPLPALRVLQAVVDVFEADGRAVPVFNDKHLSYSFDEGEGDGGRRRSRLGFPLLAGSSLPVTWRLPPSSCRWTARSRTP